MLSNLSNLTKQDTEEAIAAADVVLLLVNNRQFVELDQSLLGGKTIIDTKGIWR